MKKRIAFAFVVLALLLAACGAKALAPMYDEAGASPTQYREPAAGIGGGGEAYDSGYGAMPTPAPSGLTYSEAPSAPDVANQAAPEERMVMMNADLTLVVADPRAKAEDITRLARELGGYVVSLQMYQSEMTNGRSVPGGYVSIRIPQDRLETALTRLKSDAIEVRNESRTSQDVTSQYVDLDSQLANLERAEQDLLAIMDEARNNPGNDYTTKTQDVLNVYYQIVSIRSQIEQIKGQMKYFEDVTATSLINVNLIAEETVQPIQIGPWSPKGAWNKAIEDLVDFWHSFVEALITFVILVVPVLILTLGPFALIAWAIIAGLKRRKAKKAKAA